MWYAKPLLKKVFTSSLGTASGCGGGPTGASQSAQRRCSRDEGKQDVHASRHEGCFRPWSSVQISFFNKTVAVLVLDDALCLRLANAAITASRVAKALVVVTITCLIPSARGNT